MLLTLNLFLNAAELLAFNNPNKYRSKVYFKIKYKLTTLFSGYKVTHTEATKPG